MCINSFVSYLKRLSTFSAFLSLTFIFFGCDTAKRFGDAMDQNQATLELQVLKFDLIDDELVLVEPTDGVYGIDFDENVSSLEYDLVYLLDTSGSGRYETLSHGNQSRSLFFDEAENFESYCVEDDSELRIAQGNTLTKVTVGLGFCVLTDQNNIAAGRVINKIESTNGRAMIEIEYVLIEDIKQTE